MTAKAESNINNANDALVDLQPGVHTSPDERGNLYLIAHQCKDCGTRSFPRRRRCVSCYGENIEAVQLGRQGKVDAFTTVRQAPPGYYGPVPYVLAMVIVESDIVTLCHLVGRDSEQWQRGDAVTSCELILPVGSSQQLKRTFAFRPVSTGDSR